MSTAGCTSVQGGRPYNEDTHVSDAEFLRTRSSCFQLHAVFDGHGGASVAEFCAERIPETLRELLLSRVDMDALDLPGPACQEAVSVVESALKETVMDMNNQLHSADSKKFMWMGSTAVVCLMYKQHIWVANTGDSRAVRGRAGGAADLTQDHKASCPNEQQRITEAGGQVLNNGGWRLMGVLAVTRAVGDLALRNYGLTACPDVFHFERDEADEFLILASDGLWDVLSNQEAVQLVRRVFHKVSNNSNPCDACRVAASVLTRVALRKHSRDNITALVIDLHAPHRPATPRHSYMAIRQPAKSYGDSDIETEEVLARSSLAALMAAPTNTTPRSSSHSQAGPSLRVPAQHASPCHMADVAPMDADLDSLPPHLLQAAALSADPSHLNLLLSAPGGYSEDLAALLAMHVPQQQQQQPEDAALLYPYGYMSPEEMAALTGFQPQPMDDFASALLQQQQPHLSQLPLLSTDAHKAMYLSAPMPPQDFQQQAAEPSLRAGPTLRAGTPASASSNSSCRSSSTKACLRLKQVDEGQEVESESPGKRLRASSGMAATDSDMDATVVPVLLYHPDLYAGAYMLHTGAVRAC